ncbi:MAG: CPBP family intramembrane glutamic endopeptidase [Thermoanaerobaculia bacterium]
MNDDRWRVLASVLLFMLSCAVVLAAVAPMAPALFGVWRTPVIGLATSIAALGLTALFVRWERMRMQDVGAAFTRRSLARFALGFLIGTLMVALWATLSFAAGSVRWVPSGPFDAPATIAALAGFLALASREELAFHGYPLRRMQRSFGLWPAQIFVAVIFAAEHRLGGLPWLEVFLGAAVGSLLFGMVSIATRGLAMPIGLHAAWNFGQWTLGLKGGHGVLRPGGTGASDARAYATALVLTVVVMGSATLAFWLWDRRAAEPTADADSK